MLALVDSGGSKKACGILFAIWSCADFTLCLQSSDLSDCAVFSTLLNCDIINVDFLFCELKKYVCIVQIHNRMNDDFSVMFSISVIASRLPINGPQKPDAAFLEDNRPFWKDLSLNGILMQFVHQFSRVAIQIGQVLPLPVQLATVSFRQIKWIDERA